jgi:hypothetical protein
VQDRWREAAKAAGKGADLAAMQAPGPDLAGRESLLLGSVLRQVVDGLPEGGRVVLPLGKGKGVLLAEHGGHYRAGPLG